MNIIGRLSIVASCALCIGFTPSARADYVGLEVVDRIDLEVCKDASGEPEIPFKLDVCEIYAVFDDSADRVISVAFTNVSTTDPAGFFQHSLNFRNTAPACALIALEPTLVCDSFITIGLECSPDPTPEDPTPDATTPDVDFSAFEFASNGQVVGGWFNAAPPNGQGVPDANGRVLLARFSYKQNKNTSGDVCVFAQLAGSKDITSFLLQPFDCSVPGGGLAASGPGGGGSPTLFVDDDGDPGNGCCIDAASCNGWADACPDLQTVLGLAGASDVIRVAGGTYAPAGPAGDRADTFQLIDDVVLEGGFLGCPGGACVSPDDRDIQLYESILTGDLDGDDSDCCVLHEGSGCDDSSCDASVCGSFEPCCTVGWTQICVNLAELFCGSLCENEAENSYHVVTGSNTANTAVLDGFTVRGGNADAQTGNGFCFGDPMIQGCNDTPDCEPEGTGPCVLINATGGGMIVLSGDPTVTNCTFNANFVDGAGGGMYIGINSNPTITDCTFSFNSSGGGAGGMCNNFNSDSTITNCTFSSNTAVNGGGMGNRNLSDPMITDCAFISNIASGGNPSAGGGLYTNDGNPMVLNSTFSGNSADLGGGMANKDVANGTVTDCEFVDNFTLAGTSFGNGGGLYNNDSSVTVTGRFTNNNARYGGGIFDTVGGTVSVTNSLFSDNRARDAGGGLFNDVGVTLVVTNCVFDGNVTSDVFGSIDSEGAALNLRGSSTVTNCTFSNNVTEDQGTGLGLGGAVWLDTDVTMNNCLMWGDSATVGDEIYIEADGALTIDFGDAEGGEAAVFVEVGGTLNWGDRNIDVDPAFASSGSGNLHIKPGSPCIDAADNRVDGLMDIDTDLDGAPRFLDDPATEPDTGEASPEHPEDVVDMGAYEFQLCPGASGTCPWDLDVDSEVGAFDLAVLLGNWGLNPGHAADFDCDAFVKAFDLANLLGNWGACP